MNPKLNRQPHDVSLRSPQRRKLLRHSGVAFFSGLAGSTFIPIVSAAEEHNPDFIEKSVAAPVATPDRGKILVTYASMFGSTSGIALAIAEQFAQQGHSVDVRQAKHVATLQGYQAIVIGSAIKGSEWLPEARDFLKSQAPKLAGLPMAWFQACMTLAAPDESGKMKGKVDGWYKAMEKEYPTLKPVAKESFAGALDFKKLSTIQRYMYPLIAGNSREGDFRNLQRVREWARETEKKMFV